MDFTGTFLAPVQEIHQGQHDQQAAPPTDNGGHNGALSSQDPIANGWLAPSGSQVNTLPSFASQTSLDEYTGPTWEVMPLNGQSIDHPLYMNVYPQNGVQNGVFGGPLPGQEPFPYIQPGFLHYTLPGGQGYPFLLEANVRNLHAHEFLNALNQEKMGFQNRNFMRRKLQLNVSTIRSSDLNGDSFDFQGIPWQSIGIPRQLARRRRLDTFVNHTNIRGTDMLKDPGDKALPAHQNYFRFRRTDTLDDTRLAHFQLRNLLACPNRTQAFYTAHGGLRCINPLTGCITPALKMTPHASFSAIAADFGVVMAGTLNGSYSMRRLDATISNAVEGVITRSPGGGTNHLDMYTSRGSASPHVGICSNDSHFRIMDLRTQTIFSSWESDTSFNCSSVSKDGRMRAMTGDIKPVVICDANSGVKIHSLTGHRDYGFACAWSDDGWTLATGNQDKKLCIWDARKWCDSNGNSRPLTIIKGEMSGVRCLRFSPVGSGKPVLVAAEEADFVNIIDSQTYNSKQTIDIFGNIGGVAFANEGRDLNVFCCDPTRGSLMQFERCGQEVEPLLEELDETDEGFDLSSEPDPRPMTHKETLYRDLMQDYIDAF